MVELRGQLDELSVEMVFLVHLTENIMRKVAFKNGHFFTDAETLIVGSTHN